MGTSRRGQTNRSAGFTVVEILIVMAMILMLVGLSFVNLGRPQAAGTISTTLNTLLTDLKDQQLMAMTGGTGGGSAAVSYGIYVQSNQFTLFSGSSYSGSDPHNFTESAGGITLSTTLPSSIVIFQKGIGDVQSYTSGSDTITLTGKNITRTITINRYGGLTIN